MRVMWERFGIQSLFISLDNEPWCRISASVYNELGDYEKLASAILELLSEDLA